MISPVNRSTVLDHFSSGEDFEAMLEAAESLDQPAARAQFLTELRQRWEGFGCRMFLTEGQYDFLRRCAGEKS